MRTKQIQGYKRKSYVKELKEKQILDEQIEEEVNRLKKRLNEVQETYQKEVYLLLEQILKLRQKQIKKYNIGSLAKERDIHLTAHQIAYLFGYRYLSKFAHDEIDKGNLKLSTALYIIRQDIRYRNHEYQDKVIKMYLDGKLLTTEISRLSNDIIFDKVNYNKEIELANKQLIRMSGSIQEYTKVLKSRKKLFSDKKTLNYLKNQTKKFMEIQASFNSLFRATKHFDEQLEQI